MKWLDEKDHALLVLGGYRSFGPDGFRGTPLADALPVVFASGPPYQSEEPFSLELTEEGRRHPIFEISGDRVKDAAAWAVGAAALGDEPGPRGQAGGRRPGGRPGRARRRQARRGGGRPAVRRGAYDGPRGRHDLAMEPPDPRPGPVRHALRPVLEPDGALALGPEPRRPAPAARREHRPPRLRRGQGRHDPRRPPAARGPGPERRGGRAGGRRAVGAVGVGPACGRARPSPTPSRARFTRRPAAVTRSPPRSPAAASRWPTRPPSSSSTAPTWS